MNLIMVGKEDPFVGGSALMSEQLQREVLDGDAADPFQFCPMSPKDQSLNQSYPSFHKMIYLIALGAQ